MLIKGANGVNVLTNIVHLYKATTNPFGIILFSAVTVVTTKPVAYNLVLAKYLKVMDLWIMLSGAQTIRICTNTGVWIHFGR